MKYTLALALTLLGCAYGVEDPTPPESKEEPTPAPTPKIDEEPSDNGGSALPCDRREVVTFVIDGKTIVFRIPTLCDPTPYIEKGDPPLWNPTPSTLTSR